MDKKRVYTFGNGQAEGKADMRNLLGGKGANLAEMNLIGVPVPPGFTITTEVCTEYYEMGQDKVVALLKNEVEQAIAHVETLMRYIRIFSDLSNQIRFASQKRVLVEIALIKLCRPAMETNLDSVLDRLRVLEKQMEERPVQQVIVRESEAGGTGEPGAAVTGTATVQQQKPQKAAPEDLQKIVAGWRAIVGQTTGLFKQSLQRAVPKYNGETGDPILYVEFQDFLGMNYVDNPEAKKELQDIIAARTGKSVEIHMLVANKHQHTNLAQITVDDALRENIHMDIVVEEDPDEES